ncbi:MAG: hypothetical protein IT376_08940 [Polyangiaceae bacterium]|nr:hypothetical protein [Polyangiaceae bacterium]
MTFTSGLAKLGLTAVLMLGTGGCLKAVLLKGQIKGTRDGSGAVNTLHDYEVARAAAFAGIAQIEGMHKLAPENTDALFMLTRAWSGVGFGFIEDEYELAYERGDELQAEYHLLRARAAFERGRFYGIELLGHQDPSGGFEAARRNDSTIRAWLKEYYTEPEQAEELLWVGYAWIGHVSQSKDVPEIVGELYVGAAMIERSVELDETVVYATGHTILGAYHARTAQAELDESKKHFDRALELNGGKFLATKLNLAKSYYCQKGDREAYERTLNEVLAAGDVLPEARLQNTIAKRRARRYLGNKIWQDECGFQK